MGTETTRGCADVHPRFSSRSGTPNDCSIFTTARCTITGNPSMTNWAIVNVYLRLGVLYVAPSDGVADVESVEVARDERSLGEAIDRALDIASRVTTVQTNLRDYKWPVLAVAGLKSARQFERGLKLLQIVCENGTSCTLQRYMAQANCSHGLEPADICSTDVLPVGSVLAAKCMAAFQRGDWRVR